MGILGAMVKLTKMSEYELAQRDNPEFINNPLRRYKDLVSNARVTQRPVFDINRLRYDSQAKVLVHTGKIPVLKKLFYFSYQFVC